MTSLSCVIDIMTADGPTIKETQSYWVSLNHCGLVTPYGNIDLGQNWLR